MRLSPQSVKYIVVHCSATPPDADIGAAEITKWHKAKGWTTIGYHLVIRRDGRVEGGRPLNEAGSHAYGYNGASIGICLVGGVNREVDRDGKDDVDGPRWDMVPANNFTPAQFNSLRTLLPGLLQQFSRAKVLGHRDLPRVLKACPSFDVRTWCKEVGL